MTSRWAILSPCLTALLVRATTLALSRHFGLGQNIRVVKWSEVDSGGLVSCFSAPVMYWVDCNVRTKLEVMETLLKVPTYGACSWYIARW